MSQSTLWETRLTAFEAQAASFWQNQVIHRAYLRQQSPEIWRDLSNRLTQIINLSDAGPLTDVESFLLYAAPYLIELGWQHATGPNLTVAERYRISAAMIMDAGYQHKLGLSGLPSDVVSALATLCESVPDADISAIEPKTPVNRTWARLQYLSAVLQLGVHTQLRPTREASIVWDELVEADQLNMVRLLLQRYIRAVDVSSSVLAFYVELHPQDMALADRVLGVIQQPVIRWLWARQQHQLRATDGSKFTLKSPAVKSNDSQKPLIALAPHLPLLSFLAGFEPTLPPSTEDPQSYAQRPREPQVQYEDFHLTVRSDNLIVSRSSEGEREAPLTAQLTDEIEYLAGICDLINERNTNEDRLIRFGKRLYQLIFPGNIHAHFVQTEAVTRQKGLKIRVRLTIEHSDLAALPWEFVYREEHGHYMSLDANTVLTHYLQLAQPITSVRRRTGPLNLLMIVSNPQDLHMLDVAAWRASITDPLANTDIVFRFVEPFVDAIYTAVLEQPPDIVQFVGHGVYDQRGYLALVDPKTQRSKVVSDADFANLFLGNSDNLGLVCLAACESGQGTGTTEFSGVAQRLVQRGIPAVVGMRYSVKISTAAVFFRTFYQAIAAGRPVDWAVQWSRNRVALESGLNQREFATPVLFMRAPDGKVF